MRGAGPGTTVQPGNLSSLANCFSFQDSDDILQRFVDTLLKVTDMESWPADRDRANSMVYVAVSEAEAVRHHWASTAAYQQWTAEGGGRQDDVVDVGVSWVCIQAMERLAFGQSQLLQSL